MDCLYFKSYNFWFWLYYIFQSILNSCAVHVPYLRFYLWYYDPSFNVLKLFLDGFLLSLNPMQSFKVKFLVYYLSTDTSTRKLFTHTQPSAGQIILIIYHLKYYRYLSVLNVACCRYVRGCTKSTCIQLRIPSTLCPFWGLLFSCHQVLVFQDLELVAPCTWPSHISDLIILPQ